MIEDQIAKVVDAIATVGISKALQAKLAVLEQQRDDLLNAIRELDSEPVDLAPRLLDGWRKLVRDMGNLAQCPDARPEDMEAARERLRGLIGNVLMFPDQGTLVAEFGLRQTAFGDPRQKITAWGKPSISVVAGGGFVRSHSASLRSAA